MAVSLQFYTDSGLQIPVTTQAINHLVDGSSDPQDFIFYIGSVNSLNKYEAASDPGVDDMVLEISNVTALWVASVAKIVDDEVRTIVQNGFVFKVQSITGGGLTGAVEPTWPTTIGLTVVDNEVTWVNDGKIHEPIEIKLALTAIGLDSVVAGQNLNIGTIINGGVPGAAVIYMRIDDATAVVAFATELGLSINNVIETVI